MGQESLPKVFASMHVGLVFYNLWLFWLEDSPSQTLAVCATQLDG
jgi:hypothetical protein